MSNVRECLLTTCHHFLTDKWPLWLDSTNTEMIEHYKLEKAVKITGSTFTLNLHKLPKQARDLWLKEEEENIKQMLKTIKSIKQLQKPIKKIKGTK